MVIIWKALRCGIRSLGTVRGNSFPSVRATNRIQLPKFPAPNLARA